MTSKFEGVRGCVFDAYGTLFDFNSAVARHADRLGPDPERLSALWRSKQLEYTWLRSLMNAYADFWQVTQDALDYALEALDLRDPDLRQNLLDEYRKLDAYPDAKPALEQLAGKGYVVAILSNGTLDMLNEAVRSSGIANVRAILSVEQVGVFKPAPRVYIYAGEVLAIHTPNICFVSANAWDAAGAAAVGMRTVWVNRAGSPPERLPYRPTAEVKSLTETAALMP